MNYEVKRTDEEINNLLNTAAEVEFEGSKYPGMTFEQGIQEGIDWILGHQAECPMGEDNE